MKKKPRRVLQRPLRKGWRTASGGQKNNINQQPTNF